MLLLVLIAVVMAMSCLVVEVELLRHMLVWSVFFFFFQAEDGIRDIGVTGVQTCALPISPKAVCPVRGGGRRGRRRPRPRDQQPASRRSRDGRPDTPSCPSTSAVRGSAGGRSGERRVGEEWRSRWSPCHLKKKKYGQLPRT